MKEALSKLLNAIKKKPNLLDNLLEALVRKGELHPDGKIIVRENIECLIKSFKKFKRIFGKSSKDSDKSSDSAKEFHTRLGIIGKYIELDTFMEKLDDLYSTTVKDKIMNLLYLTYDILYNILEFEKIKWSKNFATEAEAVREILKQESMLVAKSESESKAEPKAGPPAAGVPPRAGPPAAGVPPRAGPP
ncbi:MAG: hypothetical protein ACFFD2_12520, partial [Promethearchaeota archaeon]